MQCLGLGIWRPGFGVLGFMSHFEFHALRPGPNTLDNFFLVDLPLVSACFGSSLHEPSTEWSVQCTLTVKSTFRV